MDKNNKQISYYIVVVSKNHLQRGIEGGFMQSNHGKPTLLKRLENGDKVIFYSPKVTYEGTEKLQKFTALAEIDNDEIYQVKIDLDFNPFRKDVVYKKCNEVSILPLIAKLDFIQNKQSWGYAFRFGYVKISESDFNLIKSELLPN